MSEDTASVPEVPEPQAPSRTPRPTPAALAPLEKRPAVGPPGRSLSKPRLPLTIPGPAPQPPPPPPPPPPPAPTAATTTLPIDAREAASLTDLKSPVAGSQSGPPPRSGAAPTSNAPLQPSAPPPQRRLSQTTGPPLRDAPSPPPALQLVQADPHPPSLPGAIPGTPTAAETQARSQALPPGQAGQQPAALAATTGTGAAAAAKSSGRREPPKEPPPPGAVHHVSLTTDGRTVEQYIPFGFVELRGKLLADFPHVFTDPGVTKKFVELCKWISLRNLLRLELDYGDAEEKYAPLDPDKDTLAFKAAAAAAAVANDVAAATPAAARAEPVTKHVSKADLKAMVADLYGELDRILDKAEFTELPPGDLEDAKNHKSLMGLEVTPAPEELLEYRLHYRGTRTKTIQFLRWGLFKRQIEMNVYERLAICFRLRKPVHEEDLPAEAAAAGDGALGVDTRPWYRRWMPCSRRVSAAPALLELRDEFVYMKLFKDVLQSDVDMLLPGAVIKFTWFDYAMVWVPILVGCGMAIWKAVNGTFDFSNLVNAALSIVLIVMPITWGVRAYFAVKEKQRLHQAHLNALFLLHNLNNNAGVIAQLLGEAQEQEDNETILAYFFLWQGDATPKPLPKVELDRAVEAYLQQKLDELSVAIRMDYEVIDSITKLERLGLVQLSRGEDGVKRLQALPLDLALEKAHVRHFDETREAGQPEVHPTETKRQGSIGLAWHECADIFRPTGQRFRYFWNAHTGESQYQEPDEPYIKLGTAAAALDLDEAHGVNMSDPKKHTSLHHAKTA